jgi:hypothetical protein
MKEENKTYFEKWQPSVQLRWFEKKSEYTGGFKTEKILQQLHTSNLGNREWKDVPLVKD